MGLGLLVEEGGGVASIFQANLLTKNIVLTEI